MASELYRPVHSRTPDGQPVYRLFVYGGLLSKEIRKYKKVKLRAIRNARLLGYEARYEFKVRNCKKSLYHVPYAKKTCYFGMLNLRHTGKGFVDGQIFYLTAHQLKRFVFMEPGYDLMDVGGGLLAFICHRPDLLDQNIVPNPHYHYMVEEARQHITRALNRSSRN